MQEDESVQPEHLTTAVGVFALGLMTHEYLTGSLPAHDERYGSPADAVNAGETLRLDSRLSDSLQGLIRATTSLQPGKRPRMGTYLKALKDPTVCALVHRRPGTAGSKPPAPAAPAAPLPEEEAPGERVSRIRSNVGRPPASAKPEKPAPETETATPTEVKRSRVRINLGDRRKP